MQAVFEIAWYGAQDVPNVPLPMYYYWTTIPLYYMCNVHIVHVQCSQEEQLAVCKTLRENAIQHVVQFECMLISQVQISLSVQFHSKSWWAFN